MPSSPASLAYRTTKAGSNAPSDTSECVWRSYLDKGVLAREVPPDDQLLDLRRSFVQCRHARVAQVPSDRIPVDVPVAAARLRREFGALDRRLRRVALTHRGRQWLPCPLVLAHGW